MKLRVWWAVFALRMRNMLQYRTAAWAGLLTQLAWGFMLVMLYQAFYRSGIRQSIDLSQMVSYIWLQEAFMMVIMTLSRDWEIGNMVITGQVAYELCRPQDLYFVWYARLLAQRFAGAALRCGPVLLVALLLPKPFGLSLPASVAHFVLFAVTLVLAGVLLTAINMIIHTLVFKIMDLGSASLAFYGIMEFLGGSILPVPFMPAWLRTLCYCLPFRYTSDLPFRLYSGNISLQEGLVSVGIQVAWTLLFIGLGRLFLNKQLKNVVVQGG